MRLNQKTSRKIMNFRLVFVILILMVFTSAFNSQTGRAMQSVPVGAEGSNECVQVLPAPTDVPVEVEKLCGALLIMKDVKEEKYYLGLQVCSRNAILIFKVRPRELHNYYYLGNPSIQRGDTISTDLGKFNSYITNFETYHPIQNCRECSKAYVPPQGQLIGTPLSTSGLIFPTSTLPLSPSATFQTTTPTNALTVTPSLTPSPAISTSELSLTQSNSTELALIPSPSLTPLSNPTSNATVSENTPPALENPEAVTNDNTLILTSLIVAIVLTFSIGYFYMRRRNR